MHGHLGTTIICPHCLRKVGADGKCPCCENEVVPEDWEIKLPGGQIFNPCDPRGLEEPYAEDLPYRGREIASPDPDGHVSEHKEGYEYYPMNGVATIGGGGTPTIRIDGAPGLSDTHAVLVRRDACKGFQKGWWLFDCGNDSVGTYVNRKRVVRSRLLREDDRIEIAGVPWRLCFDGSEDSENVSLKVARKQESGKNPVIMVEHIMAETPSGKKLLDDVTFSVERGVFVGIVGPSGCGKSSLIQRLAGLAKFSGQVEIFGDQLVGDRTYSEASKKVAYLPQNVERSLHESLTIQQEIHSYCSVYNVDAVGNSDKILKTLGLQKKKDSHIRDLSGGEKRRVGIALALLREPKALLLDEPCAGLDPFTATMLMEYLYKLSANEGQTILCVTHILDDLDYFDGLLVLREGGKQENKKNGGFISPGNLLEHYKCSRLVEVYDRLRSGKTETDNPLPDWKSKVRDWLASCRNGFVSCWRCLWPFEQLELHFKKLAKRFLHWGISMFGDMFRPGFLWTLKGYVLRSFWEMSWRKWIWYVVQPFIIVVGLRVAGAYMFRESAPLVRFGGTSNEILDFCVVLSMFWLGLINSAREFVKERVPGRCLDRLGGVPLLPYLLAKYAWAVMICVVQCSLFTLFFRISGMVEIDLQSTTEATKILSTCLTVPWKMVLPLTTCSLIGVFCGLAVSASVGKDMTAVMIVPNLAVFAMLFSETVMQFDSNGAYTLQWAVWVAREIMPCYAPSKAVSSVLAGNLGWAEMWPAVKLAMFYFVGSFIMFGFLWQRHNERKWEGRG